MNVIFWQIMPSHHQSGAIRHLAEIWPGHVFAVYDKEMLENRKSLGWQQPNMGKVKCFYLYKEVHPALFAQNMVMEHPNAIHVLGGFRGCLSTELAWNELRKIPGARLCCIAERPNFNRNFKFKYLAPIWYQLFFWRFGRRFKAVFAMGELGEECFRRLGCPKKIIYPYMYQTEVVDCLKVEETSLQADNTTDSQSINFVYVGKFDHRKGVDLILDAFGELPGDWTLDWIGQGGELESAVKLSADENRIRFLGSIPSDQIINRLITYDICLVPSRHDGWGMVTNEALTAERGVLISDAVGSKDLVIASGAGRIMPAGDPQALRVALQNLLDNPHQVGEWKQRARAYRERISPEVVGKYMADVLKCIFIESGTSSPTAPWLQPVLSTR